MARLSAQSRVQLAAMAEVRWHMFVHSLRTTRGALELVSRIVIGIVITTAGIGGAVGMGSLAWYFVSQHKPGALAFVLWPVFVFWQLFPIMASALTETVDTSHLLCFPLSYRAYVFVRLVYGALDLATVLCSLWLVGIVLGVGWAQPKLLPWTILVVAVFAAVNILFTQMILAWVERWLAQRRTREIFAVLFFLGLIGVQLIGPMLSRYGERSSMAFHEAGRIAGPIQSVLPPGITAHSVAAMGDSRSLTAIALFMALTLYAIVIMGVLSIRLRAQYHGENLSEVSRTIPDLKAAGGVAMGWGFPALSGEVTAVIEKEFRYLARSGPMLLTFVTPVIMLFVFGLGGRAGTDAGFLQHWPQLGLPVGAGYSLLLLTNLIYNNFGGDGSGIQFFLAAPASFRTIVLGKNLAHLGVLALEVILLSTTITLLFHPPSLLTIATTIAGLLFAAPLSLAAGNLLSLYSPKKIEVGTFGRQRASQITVLASFVIQIFLFGVCALTMLGARYYGRPWLAVVFLFGLSVISLSAYGFALSRVDRLALRRREVLVAELCK